MAYPKFILTSKGYFRLGMVRLHKDLLQQGESCFGGGFYEFDYLSNLLILSGSSYDFGRPKWGQMNILKVPDTYRGFRIVYREAGCDYVVNDNLKIEYV